MGGGSEFISKFLEKYMITSISLCKVATYQNKVDLSDLKKINFIYGYNGSGKTTISRVLADKSKYPDCLLSWQDNNPIDIIVYNKDFIDANFSYSNSSVKGIFTLGEDKIEIKNEISNINSKLLELNSNIFNLNQSLKVKKESKDKLDKDFEDKMWDSKKEYESIFRKAIQGHLGSKISFKNKILEEYSNNQNELLIIDVLKDKYDSLFGDNTSSEINIPEIDSKSISKIINDTILKKKIIGSVDVDISALIEELNNSDWVRQGKEYLKGSDGICPFCQQEIRNELEKKLEKYFDDTYSRDIEYIHNLIYEYKKSCKKVIDDITSIISSNSKFVDIDKLNNINSLLDKLIDKNIKILDSKKNEPSQIVFLESLDNYIEDVNKIIKKSNDKIDKHNSMVENIRIERSKIIKDIWRYLVECNRKGIEIYKRESNSINKDIKELEDDISRINKIIIDDKNKVIELERQITGIQTTANNINNFLSSYGFNNFHIKVTDDKRAYQIVRNNGEYVEDTLSEGEKTLITFIYFYHLLKGSQNGSGIGYDKIVVIDDPISSLDSNNIFIIGDLIRNLCTIVKNNDGDINVKQIFILTHNVYFHKEITNRQNDRRNCSFWVVRKENQSSYVKRYESNPIKSSYELLWSSIRDRKKYDILSLSTVQNTLRKILENYFQILGNIDISIILNRFEGDERIICRSLVSWMHDGSHSIYDDLSCSFDEQLIDNYLCVFKKIFEKLGHENHYKMMMNEEIP